MSLLQYDRRDVVALLTELEFFSVVSRVPSPDGSDAGQSDAVQEAETPTDYTVVQSQAQLDSMIAAIEEMGKFTFDTETTSLDAMQAELVGLSSQPRPGGHGTSLWATREGEQLSLESVLAPCASAVRVAGHRQVRPQRQLRYDRAGQPRGQVRQRGLRHHDRCPPAGSQLQPAWPQRPVAQRVGPRNDQHQGTHRLGTQADNLRPRGYTCRRRLRRRRC